VLTRAAVPGAADAQGVRLVRNGGGGIAPKGGVRWSSGRPPTADPHPGEHRDATGERTVHPGAKSGAPVGVSSSFIIIQTHQVRCHCEVAGEPKPRAKEGDRSDLKKDAMRISIQSRGDRLQRPAAFRELDSSV